MTAAWTAPTDLAVDDIVTAAIWNQFLGANGGLQYLYSQGISEATRQAFRGGRRRVAEFIPQSPSDGTDNYGTVGGGFSAYSSSNAFTLGTTLGEPKIAIQTAGGATTCHIASTTTAGSLTAVLRPNKSPRMLVRFLAPAAHANLTHCHVGFMDSASATANGAYLRMNSTGNLFFVTRQGGSETVTDLGSRSTSIVGYEIETANAGVTWVCRNAGGTVVATHTTNVPTAATDLAYGVTSVTSGAASSDGAFAYCYVEATF